MRVAVCSIKTVRWWGMAAACAAVAVLLMCYPQAMQTGVRRGLAVCGELLIPSLFPFLVLSGFVIRSGMANGIGRRLSPLMGRIFGFSGSAAAAMVIAVIGGYPAGANAVAQLCEQGDIRREEAQRLLRCCVSAGPAFIIGGIGVGMLGSVKAGVLLLVAHWLAFAAVALTQREKQSPCRPKVTAECTVGTAVTESVNAAALSLLSMCGFVLLASGVLSLADALGGAAWPKEWRCLFACVTEVSMGCVEAAGMGRMTPFWLGAALGFGGLSVHGQIAARTAPHIHLDRGFFTARLLHALLGGGLSQLFFLCAQPAGAAAGATLSAFAPQSTAAGMSGLVAMMLMSVLFLYTLPLSYSRT